ncbi:hypothetical protein [Nocardia arthritidis]|uniref:Uncharacterized protein n=1 Tax=Nocardia arthritidis TaxID=228602 RepID=A0A6G9YT69_9NOCA|nr:hypothetical protein [Nocardia arthritidis]QIS16206.1 hypothetical protein F5544_41985 [Nocardia arthritidis]
MAAVAAAAAAAAAEFASTPTAIAREQRAHRVRIVSKYLSNRVTEFDVQTVRNCSKDFLQKGYIIDVIAHYRLFGKPPVTSTNFVDFEPTALPKPKGLRLIGPLNTECATVPPTFGYRPIAYRLKGTPGSVPGNCRA